MRTPPLRWRWMLNTLEGIGEDVAQLKGANSDVLAAIESLRQTNVEGFQQLIARDADLAIASDSPEGFQLGYRGSFLGRGSPTSSPTSWASSGCRPFSWSSCWSPSCSTWARRSGSRSPTNGGLRMDAFLNVLLVLSLLGVVAYAFAVYEVLKIVTAWARDRWKDGGASARLSSSCLPRPSPPSWCSASWRWRCNGNPRDVPSRRLA